MVKYIGIEEIFSRLDAILKKERGKAAGLTKGLVGLGDRCLFRACFVMKATVLKVKTWSGKSLMRIPYKLHRNEEVYMLVLSFEL